MIVAVISFSLHMSESIGVRIGDSPGNKSLLAPELALTAGNVLYPALRQAKFLRRQVR